jgi:hypothetical protein
MFPRIRTWVEAGGFGGGRTTKLILKRSEPYLRRWYIIDNERLILMLHNICQPDNDRWLHDHPWWFLSIVLRGGYVETRTKRNGQLRLHRVRRVNFVGRRTFHRIESVEPNTWTLVLCGSRGRTWAYRVPWKELPEPAEWSTV